VELVDTHALGACASRREGSSPFIRTNIWQFFTIRKSPNSRVIFN